MTISSTTNRVSYAGDGTTTGFSFPHRFLADEDLTVILVVDSTGVETTQTLTTDYTVSGAGDAGGGTVTMATAPASGETLVIINDPDLTQGYDPEDGSALAANSMEAAFDRLTIIAQRIKTLVERSFRLPDGDTSGASLELPAPTALRLLRWNSDGDALELVQVGDLGELSTGRTGTDVPTNSDISVDSVSDLQAIDTDAVPAAFVIYVRSRISAGDGGEGHFRWDSSDLSTEVAADEVTTNEGDGGIYVAPASDKTGASGAWVRQFESPTSSASLDARWYGLKADGSTDDSDALTAAISALPSNGGQVVLPPGEIVLLSTVTLIANMTLRGAGMTATKISSSDTAITIFDTKGATQARLIDMEIGNTTGNRVGVGIDITDNGGNTNDLILDRVMIRFLNIGITVTGLLTVATFRNCIWRANASESFQLGASATINSIRFQDCRWESSDSEAYKALTSGQHGGVVFDHCVIEAQEAQYAVNLGTNAVDYHFNQCHFEDNGGGNANARDVLVGAGGLGISFTKCNFSNPRTGSTNFFSVDFGSSVKAIIFSENHVSSTDANYDGLYTSTDVRPDVTLLGNIYRKSQTATDARLPVSINEDAFVKGGSFGPMLKELSTTDATTTTIWEMRSLNVEGETHRGYYVIADVTAIADDGSEYASYTRRILVTHTGTASPTSRGTTDETAVESTGTMDCAFQVSADASGTLRLRVTGVASTNINWFAKVDVVFARA